MQNKYTIIRDTREKEGFGWNFPANDLFEKSITKKLDSGDYSLLGYEDKISIERKKNTSEIAKNIFEPRFEKELIRLQDYSHSYIICEFTFNDLLTFPVNSGIPKNMWYKVKMTSKFLQSTISRYMVQYNTKIIFAGLYGKECAEQLFRSFINYEIKKTK
jgi:hypothetical protein